MVNQVSDDLTPNPEVWASCPTCNTAYMLRRCMSLRKGWMWAWTPDCKHKATPILVDGHGPIEDNE